MKIQELKDAGTGYLIDQMNDIVNELNLRTNKMEPDSTERIEIKYAVRSIANKIS